MIHQTEIYVLNDEWNAFQKACTAQSVVIQSYDDEIIGERKWKYVRVKYTHPASLYMVGRELNPNIK
jgi:hypothetical protein